MYSISCFLQSQFFNNLTVYDSTKLSKYVCHSCIYEPLTQLSIMSNNDFRTRTDIFFMEVGGEIVVSDVAGEKGYNNVQKF